MFLASTLEGGALALGATVDGSIGEGGFATTSSALCCPAEAAAAVASAVAGGGVVEAAAGIARPLESACEQHCETFSSKYFHAFGKCMLC